MVLRRRGTLVLGACVLSVGFLSACQAAPRRRPIEMGPVAQGSGTLAAVRQQLNGAWTLASLVTYPEAGREVPLKALGELTYDEFGNLTIAARLDSGSAAPEAGEPVSLWRFSGRAAIDVQQQRLVLQDMKTQSSGDPGALPANVSADKARYYKFDGDQLILTVKDAQGRTTAVTTWKRK